MHEIFIIEVFYFEERCEIYIYIYIYVYNNNNLDYFYRLTNLICPKMYPYVVSMITCHL